MIQSLHTDFTQTERTILEDENSTKFNDAMTLESDHCNLAADGVLVYHLQVSTLYFEPAAQNRLLFHLCTEGVFESPKLF